MFEFGVAASCWHIGDTAMLKRLRCCGDTHVRTKLTADGSQTLVSGIPRNSFGKSLRGGTTAPICKRKNRERRDSAPWQHRGYLKVKGRWVCVTQQASRQRLVGVA